MIAGSLIGSIVIGQHIKLMKSLELLMHSLFNFLFSQVEWLISDGLKAS